MEYQLNPDSPWALNGTLRDNGDDTSTQPIIINPMVVGDTYGFVSGAPSKNTLDVILPNKGLDIDQLTIECQKAAEAFCAKQYPNT